jgi:hypothetical protein
MSSAPRTPTSPSMILAHFAPKIATIMHDALGDLDDLEIG